MRQTVFVVDPNRQEDLESYRPQRRQDDNVNPASKRNQWMREDVARRGRVSRRHQFAVELETTRLCLSE